MKSYSKLIDKAIKEALAPTALAGTFKKLKGKDGTIWYQDVKDPSKVFAVLSGEGFGGKDVAFELEDGSEDVVKGPSHSNMSHFKKSMGESVEMVQALPLQYMLYFRTSGQEESENFANFLNQKAFKGADAKGNLVWIMVDKNITDKEFSEGWDRIVNDFNTEYSADVKVESVEHNPDNPGNEE